MESLPAGWGTKTSGSTGATYYVNTVTGETTYDLPTEAVAALAPPGRTAAPPASSTPARPPKRRQKKAGKQSGKFSCGAPPAKPRPAEAAASAAEAPLEAPVPVPLAALRGQMSSGTNSMLGSMASLASLDLSGGDDGQGPGASFAAPLPAGWLEAPSDDGLEMRWVNGLSGEVTFTFPTRPVYDDFEMEDMEDMDDMDEMDGFGPELSEAEDAAAAAVAEEILQMQMQMQMQMQGQTGLTVVVPEPEPMAPVEQLVMPDKQGRAALFHDIDVNGNGGLSLAEIDKAVVDGTLGRALCNPDFNHKPALMRAYKAADASADGFIERREFVKLLGYLVYFNNLWHKFEEIDLDHDRRLDASEFGRGCAVVGLQLSAEECAAEFAVCDSNGGGMILFDEFCGWCARRHVANDMDLEEPKLARAAVPKFADHKRSTVSNGAGKVANKAAVAKEGSFESREVGTKKQGRGSAAPARRTRTAVAATRSDSSSGRSSSRGRQRSPSRPAPSPRSPKGSVASPRSSTGGKSPRRRSPRQTEATRASAARLSPPRGVNGVVRRARTPTRGGGFRALAAPQASLSLSGKGDIFVTQPASKAASGARGGFDPSDREWTYTEYDPVKDKYLPAKTRQKIAQRLAEAERRVRVEDEVDGMLAETEDDDDDDETASEVVSSSTPPPGLDAACRPDVADALARKYMALDSEAQARFLKLIEGS